MLLVMTMSVMAQEKFCIAKNGNTAAIVVDEQDWKGVARAANDLGDDVRKVCGTACSVVSAMSTEPTSQTSWSVLLARVVSSTNSSNRRNLM